MCARATAGAACLVWRSIATFAAPYACIARTAIRPARTRFIDDTIISAVLPGVIAASGKSSSFHVAAIVEVDAKSQFDAVGGTRTGHVRSRVFVRNEYLRQGTPSTLLEYTRLPGSAGPSDRRK